MNKARLFVGSCFSLIATAVCFAVVGAIMGPLKEQFVLSNEQVGWIGGAAIWGFTVTIFVFGPLCDVLGMRNLLWFALLCHFAGALTMIFADGFWMLAGGALVLSLGNGTVEAVCNPLIATIYPDQKTRKLNQFHMWFPGGIVLGSVASYFLDKLTLPVGSSFALWQLKLALILVPAVVYGILFIGQKFPATERVQSGISFGGMIAGALGRPLFWVLLICMCITASLELGPGRWVPAVLSAGGIAGILVLAYINGLMAILRFFAGPVIHRLSPTGILVGSAILAGIGLYWLSFADNTATAFASATVFALGVCYFWPTMLGVTAERVPRSGALGLSLLGGMGMLIVGVVTAPQMGRIADQYLHEQLVQEPVKTLGVLQRVATQYPALAEELKEPFRSETLGAVKEAQALLPPQAASKSAPNRELALSSAPTIGVEGAEAAKYLKPGLTAEALRSAVRNAPKDADSTVDSIKELIDPADNYGGRMSFRYVAPFAAVLVIVFGILFLKDRAAGGYKAEHIGAPDQH